MLKKLLVGLVASAFALSVFAQAPKSGTEKAEPKGQTGVTTEKAEPGKGKSDKTTKTAKTKAKPKTEVKADAKDSRKDATKAPKAKDEKAATK